MIYSLLSPQAIASSSDSSLVIHLGEALGPSNFRLNLKSIDIGFDGKGGGLYFGQRLWKGNTYGGAGVWIGFSSSPGIYGMIGKDWKFWNVLLTSFEFFSIGNFSGGTYAVAQLGIGVSW